MPGGLIQLVAVGVQDEKLTRDPEITFFKSVYDPYVNFAMESIENTFQGVCDFGRKVQVDIQRNGDLVTKMTLEVDVPELVDATGTGVAGVSWAPTLGHTLVRQVCVNIGGTDIDRHYGIWWDAWTELTLPTGKRVGYNLMIGQQNVQPVVGLPNGGPGSPTPQITAVTLRTVGNQTCKNSIFLLLHFNSIKFVFNMSSAHSMNVLSCVLVISMLEILLLPLVPEVLELSVP